MTNRLNRIHSLKQVGFTLIELFVTLALTIIVLLLTFPQFKPLIATEHAQQTQQVWVQALRWARLQAMEYGETVKICFLDRRQNCQRQSASQLTIFLDSDNDNHMQSSETLLGVIPIAADTQVQFNRRSIRFDQDGQASGANQTIHMCTAQRSWNIKINMAGQLSSTSIQSGCSLAQS
ncbi:GspH/FimT family pseudopilin [Celerinatantimonas sp. YJH-8]|uniref:GspH/FimT family pseudopilin n=1 Tax=Celerinatantimonas sp. YJH-8 TaxID=3228714 RepID=UPI0038C41430